MTAVATPSPALRGSARVPGDKSISHRALILGALAVGETVIAGLLEGDDVRRTAEAVARLGATVSRDDAGLWRVFGRGVGGLAAADDVLDLGNSGTGVRLLMGVAATHPFTTFFTGDASLRKRPMGRVIEPLERMGAAALSTGGRLPAAIVGTDHPIPISYDMPVASAQVKSAVLLAALNVKGRTTVIERTATRDHTELMMRHFGVDIDARPLDGGGHAIALTGQPELTGQSIVVPSDPSSAAFPLAAALVVEGSAIRLENVGLNPLRTGLFTTLEDMGAEIVFENDRMEAGEPVADIAVRHAELTGVTVPADRAPSMIDEYPVLAVIASFARGTTRFEGVGELRVKESDRLAMIAAGLDACGVTARTGDDWIEIEGTGGRPRGLAPDGPPVATAGDHRIAMAFLVMGLGARNPVRVDDPHMIDTSFPGFVALMRGLGAEIAEIAPGAPGP